MVIDYRRHRADPAPLFINGDCVKRVSTFKFLGTHIAEDLSWSANTSAVVKKDPAAIALPEGAKEEQFRGEAARHLLPLHHRECAGILYHGVVCRLLSSRKESTAKSDQNCPENHQLPSAFPGRHLQLSLPP